MKFRRVALHGFGALASIVLLAAAGAPAVNGPTDETLVVRRVEAVLASLSNLSCGTNCEFGGCVGSEHQNWTHSGGNDGGERHTCAFSSAGCGDHTCNETIGIRELETLVPSLDGASLQTLAAKHDGLLVNAERGAIQVLGCGGQVVLSVNFTEQQSRELVGASE